jgi:hypothetical protein
LHNFPHLSLRIRAPKCNTLQTKLIGLANLLAAPGKSMPELSPIEAHERVIGRIFGDEYAFEIPPYQRPYAWEKEQARDLLTDLLEAMDNTMTSGGVYFLGSIVLIKSPGSPVSKVVDGQQRLTTLTILLSVLRDLTSDMELRFERRAYVYQKASADKGTVDRYRLLLRERDQPFFLRYVQTLGASSSIPDPEKLEGSQQRIAENAQLYREQLKVMDETRRNALVAFLIQHCYLVVVAVPTADAARRIFTVLNARGLDLTATDILKADLLDRVGQAQEGPLAKRWEAVELALGREAFVELFGHIRMIYERDKPRSALESAFKTVVPPFAGDAEAFVSDVLEPIADAYALLADPKEIRLRFGADAANAVRSLQRIDSKDWIAPALLRLWTYQPDDATAVGRFLIDLERVAYGLFVIRADVNARIARFGGVMDEFQPRPGRPAATAGLSLAPEEQQEFVKALDGQLYRQSRVCKPVLQRLDGILSSGGAEYDELVVSIEHVIPQTVDETSEWARLFPDAATRSEWTHRLANLVILTRRINARASNWPFAKKKTEYFNSKHGMSPFPLTQGVQQSDTWGPAVLRNRQNVLLSRLCEVWRLSVPNEIAGTG